MKVQGGLGLPYVLRVCRYRKAHAGYNPDSCLSPSNLLTSRLSGFRLFSRMH